ncbi:PREDICTED: trypsin-like [Rhagoletis zephyria]|uniref:trypsin-like n=1 Tax=Rhagoletis zephyria TaxID=28612 RepID=UPI000811347C|nr:PREDICTED: trypsin-like [Rhagoletis zephyria]
MANKFVCTLLLLIAATGAHADGIVGGTASSISANSYLASLQLADGTIVCGGAFINSKYVVTAAYCLANYDADQLVVSVNNGAQIIKVASHTFNRGYDPTTNKNDIGVLKLAEAAVSVSYVSLADSLPTSGVLCGWDAKKSVVNFSVTIISTTNCVSGNYNYIAGDILNTMFCGLAANSACDAYPGTPLVSNNKLVGLTSWGNGCANKNNPAVYTNIVPLKLWVESVM